MATRGTKRSDETDSSGATGASAGANITVPPQTAETILPKLVAPDEEEAEGYYYGIPSTPRLLGRTSAGSIRWEWPVFYDADTIDEGFLYAAAKRILAPVGSHRMHDVHKAILPGIIAALGQIPWTSIDTVRLGYDTIPHEERPVVVWVGVRDAEVPWPVIAKALRAIRTLLDAAGLPDVECELRHAQITRLGGPPLLETKDGEFVAFEQPLSTRVGQAISCVEDEHKEGTLGLYLCSARTSHPKIWALTCRHVALPMSLHNNAMYNRLGNTEAELDKLEMTLPPPRVLEKLFGEINTRLAYLGSEDVVRREPLNSYWELFNNIRPVEMRTFGTVCLAPPIGYAKGKHPWARDWALIALDPSKVLPERTHNVVDLRSTEMHPKDLPAFLSQHAASKYAFKFRGSFFPLVGTVPVAELENISRADPNERFPIAEETKYSHSTRSGLSAKRERPMFNKYGNRCLIVGKRGGMTGLTWGVSNDFESVLRTFDDEAGIPSFMSRAWAIFGSVEDTKKPFSQRGDSGSAVFDVTGRVLGQLVAGSGDDNIKIDVTYVTPMEWIVEDVSKVVGEPVRLL